MSKEIREGRCYHNLRVIQKIMENLELVGLENHCYNCNGYYLVHNGGHNGNGDCKYHCEGHIDFLDVYLGRCFNHSKAKEAERKKEQLDKKKCLNCRVSFNCRHLCQEYSPISVDVLDFNRICGVFKNSRESSEKDPNPFSV